MLIGKLIAFFVNEFMPLDSKNLVKPRQISKFPLKLRKLRVEFKKKHERLLENNILFIGLHLIVKEVCP